MVVMIILSSLPLWAMEIAKLINQRVRFIPET